MDAIILAVNESAPWLLPVALMSFLTFRVVTEVARLVLKDREELDDSED